MKLTTFLLLFAVFQVFAKGTYSQNTKLTLNLGETTVEQVLKEIENQSEFYFLFNQKLVDINRKINLQVTEKKINEILPQVFYGTDIDFVVIDRQIVLSPGEYLTETKVKLQPFTITGTVTDENGEPLPGAYVTVKGTTIGTMTDVEGNYTIEVEDASAVLVFSMIGYITREITVGDQKVIDINMELDVIGLGDVVVVGYGTQKKVNLTGAVDVINNEQLIKGRAITNVTEALQGITPNLIITTTTTSSEPGGKMNLNIRGVGSLTGDYSPYILVDGIPMDLNSVNFEDIESITVLKDAAASAIYGARAPYGVILITTKSGEMKEHIKITYSNNISFASPIGLSHMSNSLKYATAHDQASVNAGLAPNFTPENYERIRKYMAGEITEETWLMPDGSDWYGNGIWSIAGNGNNDWLYIYFDDMVMRQKHDFSLDGGGEKNSYFVSVGYLDQPGELRYGDEYYKRYNLTANLVSKATDWLTCNLNTKYIKDDTQYFMAMEGWDRMTMYHDFTRKNSFRPLYLPNGEFSGISDIPLLQGGKENHYGSEYILSLGLMIEPVENWETKISYNYKNKNIRINQNKETVTGTSPDGSTNIIAYAISNYGTNINIENYNLINIISSYNKTFNGHYFYLLVGFENELNEANNLWGNKNNILTRKVPSISTATGEYYLGDSKTHWATQGFFSRFNYNFKEKYLLEFNARYDGSSKFEKETRWGFFPSFSIGYNVSKEAFWSSVEPYISSLKIRGSWGQLGNQNVPNYLYLPILEIGTNLAWIMESERPNYTNAPSLLSADLTWETSTTTNVGLDISFLKGKLSTTIDLYNRITSRMFGPSEALPSILGTSVPQSNNATLKTRGFEFVVAWRDNIGTNLSYNFSASLSDNVSTVTEYNNPTKTLSTWYEGAKLGEIWGLTTVGLYQSDTEAASGPDQSLFYPTWGAGDIHYKDLDGDNKITRGNWTSNDAGDYSVIGNKSPRFLTGIFAGLEWKGFDFNMFWQGVLKRDYAFRSDDMMFYGFSGHEWWDMNVWEKSGNTTLNYWRPADETNILGPNTDAYYPKPYLSKEDFKNKEIQTRYMQNASYLRLKNLSIGYTLPSNIIDRVAISNARVFISGENLVTITPLTKLIDPEALVDTGWGAFWGVGKIHPLRKVYAIGINLTF